MKDLEKLKCDLINSKSCSICRHLNHGNRGVCVSAVPCNNNSNWELDMELLDRIIKLENDQIMLEGENGTILL